MQLFRWLRPMKYPCLSGFLDLEQFAWNKRNYAGLLAEAFIQSRKNLPGLRLASRHKPGGDGADQQNSKYDYVSVWYLEFCHFYNLVMHRTLQDFRQSRMGMDNIFEFLEG